MTCAAIHFVIAIGKNSGAAWKAGIDQPHHGDHLAGHFLLGFRIGRKIALHMTVRALHSQSLIEAPHDERNFGVRREDFQIFRRDGGCCPASLLPAPFLGEQGDRQKKQKGE